MFKKLLKNMEMFKKVAKNKDLLVCKELILLNHWAFNKM